jgi:hypothetical protein
MILFGSRSILKLVILLLFAAPAAAQLPDIPQGTDTVKLQLVTDDVHASVGETVQRAPADLVPVPDASGRLFLVTLGGVVRVINAADSLLPAPYLDMTNANTAGSFHRVFSALAFHPDFADPNAPGFGAFYTVEPEIPGAGIPDFAGSLVAGEDFQQVLYEYTATDPTANVFSGTKRELFRVSQPRGDHNVFDVASDPNGLLYMKQQPERAIRDPPESVHGCWWRYEGGDLLLRPPHALSAELRPADWRSLGW